MNELEDMKTLWSDLNRRVAVLEEENNRLAMKVAKNDYKSAKEKLISKYKKFIFLEGIMILWVWLFIGFNEEVVEKYRGITLIYWTLFFILEIGIDYYLMEKIKEIDIYTSSIRKISEQAARNWRIHKIAIIFGIPLAFGAIILFGLAMNANTFMIYGMIVGGLVGLLIGFLQLRRFMTYYRQLKISDEDQE